MAETATFEKTYVFSQSVRWMHWVRMISITVLIVTGFFLAYPFVTPQSGAEPVKFLNAEMRSIHMMFGYALICMTIYRIYIFFFDRQSRIERASFADWVNPVKWIKHLMNYAFVGPHPHEKKGLYNPIQMTAYMSLTVLVLLISLTGLILYFNVYHDGLGAILYDVLKPVEAMMGGLGAVRQWHHILTWMIILFIPVHLYMAIWNSSRYPDGGIDAIFSGYHWHKKED